MLSRVAHSLFWMNRLIERIDHLARFIDTQLNMRLEVDPEFSDQWLPLIEALGMSSVFFKTHAVANRKTVMAFLIIDKSHGFAMMSMIESAREHARIVREWLSNDAWLQINQLYWFFKQLSKPETWDVEKWFEFFDSIRQSCYMISGIMYDTISDTEASQFAKMGRFLERADNITRFVDIQTYIIPPKGKSNASTLSLIHWGTILKALSAQEMYRREKGSLNQSKIIDFFIQSVTFPRSLRFCIHRAHRSLSLITGEDSTHTTILSHRLLGKLKAHLDYSDISSVSEDLPDYLDTLQVQFNTIGNAIHQQFFDLEFPHTSNVLK